VAAGDLALSIEEQLERSRPDGPVELGALRALPPAADPAPPLEPGRILVGILNRHPRDIDLGEARLREVLNLAVDRDRLIREGFGGHADPLAALILPGAPGAGSGPVPRRHDPARARELLHDLGWIHGRSLRLAGTPATALQARLVADDLQMALGIHVELQTVDVLAPGWGRRVPGWDVLLQDLPRPEPDAAPAVLHRELLGADGTLRAGPELPHVDRLLAELDATEDRVAADAVAARIDRYCFDASLALFLCAPRARPAARDLRRQEA
jgi:peptide/nickel transport system substrate-binding protein